MICEGISWIMCKKLVKNNKNKLISADFILRWQVRQKLISRKFVLRWSLSRIDAKIKNWNEYSGVKLIIK